MNITSTGIFGSASYGSGSELTFALSGTFDADMEFVVSENNGATWQTIWSGSAIVSDSRRINTLNGGSFLAAWKCRTYRSGTVVATIAQGGDADIAANLAAMGLPKIIGSSSATAAQNYADIQTALNAGGSYRLGAGVINISAPLIVYSNTLLEWDPKVTTLKLAGGVNDSVIYTRAAYSYWRQNVAGSITTLTANTTVSPNLCTAVIPNTDPLVSQLAVGKWIAILNAGVKGYGGVQKILSLSADASNTTITYKSTLMPGTTACTVSTTAYEPDATYIAPATVTPTPVLVTAGTNKIRYLIADENITINGGVLDQNAYDATNNTTGNTNVWTGVPKYGPLSASGIVAGYGHNISIELAQVVNNGYRGIYGFSLRKSKCKVKQTRNGAVAIQLLGPLHDITVEECESAGKPGTYGSEGLRDDGIALMNKEDSTGFVYGCQSEGDIQDIVIRKNKMQTYFANSQAIYAFASQFYYTGVRVEQMGGGSDNEGNFNGSVFGAATYSGFGLTIQGRSGQVGAIDDVFVDGQQQSNLVQDVLVSYVTVNKLTLKNYRYQRGTLYSAGTPSPNIEIGASASIDQIELEDFSFPLSFQSPGQGAFMQIESTVGTVNDITAKGVHFVDGTGRGYNNYFLWPKKLIRNVKFQDCDFEGLAYYLNIAGTQDVIFDNCTCRSDAYCFAEIAHASAVVNMTFNGGVSDGQSAGVILTNGTLNLYGKSPRATGRAFNGLVKRVAGTVNPKSFGIEIDVSVTGVGTAIGNIATHIGATNPGPAYATGTGWKRLTDGAVIV